MTYKEDMKFQKHLSLWNWHSSGVSAYKVSRDIDKNTATLSNVLQTCHEWAQEFHTKFEYDDNLEFLHFRKTKHGWPKKKKNTRSKKTC